MNGSLRTTAFGLIAATLAFGASTDARADLLAAYSFDNNTVNGTTVADVSGNGHNGKILPGVTTGQAGKFGESFSFSGTNSEVNAPAPYTFGSSFSISLWLNTADLGQSQKYLLLHGTDQSNQNAITFGYVPSTVEFYAPGRTGDDPRPGSQILLTQANAWSNVVYTYDGTDFRGYLNGTQVFDHVELFNLNATGPLYLGSASQIYPIANFIGRLDDIGLFNAALTSSQVAYLQSHPVATLSSVPEPASFAMLGVGVLGIAGQARRRPRRSS